MRPAGSIIVLLLVAALGGCRAKYTGAVLTEDDLDGASTTPSRGSPGVVSLTGVRSIPAPVPIAIVADPALVVGPEPEAPPEPPASQVQAAGPPGPTVVDAKVGDVNGRALYASEIIDEALGRRLEQTARQQGMTKNRWLQESRELIEQSVQRIVADELIEAEARAGLEPRQEEGLRAWLKEQGEEARRREGGSRAALDQRLREQGSSVEEWERERERGVLISIQIEEQVDKRTIVTWQDIQRYYERNYKVFNPDPTAVFRQIKLFTSDTEGVQRVRAALDAGEPFEAVARGEDNTFNREEGGLVRLPFPGEFQDTEFFGAVSELNAAAQTLIPGEWTRAPVTYGAFTVWLKLESIESIEGPLSDPDVQLRVVNTLTERKKQQVLDKYLKRLVERAEVTEFDAMTERLLHIAAERYWGK